MNRFMKFEQFNQIDPYGEENWSDEIDISGKDLDDQVKILRELILERHHPFMSEFDVDFHCSGMEYNDVWLDGGSVLDEIFDIFLNEDGQIIFVGITSVYDEQNDDYKDCNIYYTIDVRYPIYIKTTKIILEQSL